MHSNRQPTAPVANTQLTESSPVFGGWFVEHILPTWTDLSVTRRRDLASAVSCFANAVGCSKQNLWLEFSALNKMVEAHPLAWRRIRSNTRTGIRYILRRLGNHAKQSELAATLVVEWQRLADLVPCKFRRHAMIGLLRYCSDQGIAPADVTSSTLASYEAALCDQTLCRDTADKARRTCSSWNWATTHVVGWPQTQLERGATRKPYTFPFTCYPTAFQADVKRWLDAQACTDLDQIYPDDLDLGEGKAETNPNVGYGRSISRRGPARPSTLATRAVHVRQLAAALVQCGRPIAEITSLRCLVEPPGDAKLIADYFWNKAGRRPNGQTAGLIEVQLQIARFHCGLSPQALKQLSDRRARAAPPRQSGMTQKNSNRLRVLIDPRNRAVLLHLPNQLMAEAKTAASPEAKEAALPSLLAAARLAMSAVAIEILTMCPMRITNLQQLRLSTGFARQIVGKRRITHLIVASDDVKNSHGIDWPLDPSTAQLIEIYLTHYRPTIAEPGNDFLFLAVGQEPRSLSAMRATVSEPIGRWIGADINAHLFRHYAAWSYLKLHPGAYETVRRVLGHKDIRTTISYYTGLEAEFAAAHFDTSVLRERRATQVTAACVFRQKSGKKTHRPGGR